MNFICDWIHILYMCNAIGMQLRFKWFVLIFLECDYEDFVLQNVSLG